MSDGVRIYSEIGSRIRIARKRVRRSQAGLARVLGITRASIANIEAGRQRLPIHRLYEIAGALHVNPMTLLPGTKPDPRVRKAMEAEARRERRIRTLKAELRKLRA